MADIALQARFDGANPKSVWLKAIEQFKSADADLATITGDYTSIEDSFYSDAREGALQALLATPAPDAEAIQLKLSLIKSELIFDCFDECRNKVLAGISLDVANLDSRLRAEAVQ